MDPKDTHETQPASVPLPDNNLSNSSPTKAHPIPTQMSKWIVALLLLILPPAAWYFMYNDSKYHRWFAYIISYQGITASFISAAIVFFVYPQINKLFYGLNLVNANSYMQYLTYVMITFGIIMMLFGFYIFKKTSNNKPLSKNVLIISIIILFLQWISPLIWIFNVFLTVIYPVYDLTSTYN